MKKAITCILSFLPMIATVLYVVAIIAMSIISEEFYLTDSVETILVLLMLVFSLAFIVAVFGVMIYFIVHACKSPNLETGMKVLWVFLLYQFNLFALPVYWFIYMRRE